MTTSATTGPGVTARTREGWAAAAGITAVGTAVVLGEIAATLISPSVSPMTAVGGAVIDAVPPGVKDWAVSLFGTGDKVALLAGMALVIAGLAALAGVVEARRRFAGVALIAVFGLAGVAAVLGRAAATAYAPAVPVAVALAAMLLLRWLLRRLQDWAPENWAQETDAARAPDARAPVADQGEWAGPNRPDLPAGHEPAGHEPAEHGYAGNGQPMPPARPAAALPPAAAPPARRRFVQALGGTAVAGALGGVLAGTLRGSAAAVTEGRSKLVLPAAKSPAPAIPAGASIALDGLEPLVTPNADFYRIDTALRVPLIDPDKWTLKVTGLVDREIELDFAALLAKPMTERHVTIACVSNQVGGDLIGNARWLGWPVRELLAMAGPKPGADMVLSRSTDGWTAGTPLEALTDSRDAMLAVGMNGEPLPLEHGFPARLIVPGLYGYVSATKWVTELKVTRFADDKGYWTPRGWSERGPIKISSRIDVPRNGARPGAGTVVFGGTAWAQPTGVGAVDLRIDGGPWRSVELAPGISKDTWYQWKLGADLGPGQHEVQVRATDLNGVVQVEGHAPVAPDGATGYHTIRVDVKS
ncbi:molybdopterin-dependent oxidoreductase [Arthrobacter sp. PAMC25284]|uniref:molybdopterin-dependent oxidoreductase n=1 Tax=Arthrobacter sp. PAMC25284 TaxID=2861279 RepID=UPI001C6302DF|nr:molybdopterin-dependent oxidoreductase [Arthrobacter sp. PAMC25284]QYF90758.1 molybdopterin-dependent oxidoreductase [Arthrobacter sp. PAMC25284]